MDGGRPDLFREVNERIAELRRAMSSTDDELLEIYCECGTLGCVERIEMTRGEYEAIRAEPSFLILAHVHENGLAKVTGRAGRYFVVRDLRAELRGALERKLRAH